MSGTARCAVSGSCTRAGRWLWPCSWECREAHRGPSRFESLRRRSMRHPSRAAFGAGEAHRGWMVSGKVQAEGLCRPAREHVHFSVAAGPNRGFKPHRACRCSQAILQAGLKCNPHTNPSIHPTWELKKRSTSSYEVNFLSPNRPSCREAGRQGSLLSVAQTDTATDTRTEGAALRAVHDSSQLPSPRRMHIRSGSCHCWRCWRRLPRAAGRPLRGRFPPAALR